MTVKLVWVSVITGIWAPMEVEKNVCQRLEDQVKVQKREKKIGYLSEQVLVNCTRSDQHLLQQRRVTPLLSPSLVFSPRRFV